MAIEKVTVIGASPAAAAALAAAQRPIAGHALRFCDDEGFRETQLWTFKGLDAARYMYEANGFVLAEEYWGDQWGKKVREQRFVRTLGAEQ